MSQTIKANTEAFKQGDKLYLDNDNPGALIALKDQSIDTFQKQVAILKIDTCLDDQHIANHIGLTLSTYSRRLNEDDFLFDDKQRIKNLAKRKGFIIRF